MPTYEYRCPNGHEFEHFYRSISAATSEMKCPVCGETAIRKVSGGSGLVFKGSGFYITDYGKDGKKDQRPSPKPASSSDAGGKSGESGGSGEKPGTKDKGSTGGGSEA